MIIIDLEWNRSYDKIPLEEILQIGAVRLEKLGGPIVDTFSIFIRPRVHKKLNRTAKTLPELEQSLRSTVDFPQALARFVAWCGDDRVFADWGGDDFQVLRQNCAHWHLSAPKPAQLVDLQAAFSLRLGIKQGMALHRAAEYCGIPDTFTFHNALNDAMYTALVTAWIDPASLDLLVYPKEVRRLLDTPVFPDQASRRVGPCPTALELLNSRSARRQTCPLCGEVIWVRRWYYKDPSRCYADFRCPGHGIFLARLTLSPTAEDQQQGRLAVPPITQPLLEEFHAALHGRSVDCKGGSKRRKRHRRRPARRRSEG